MALAQRQPSIPQEETKRICRLGISPIYGILTTPFGKKVSVVTKVLIFLYISRFQEVLLKKTAKKVVHRLHIRWTPSSKNTVKVKT